MPVFFYDPRKETWLSFCDRCAKEEQTRNARQEQGWEEVRLGLEDPKRQEQGLWYCQTCGALLEDVPPIRFV